MPLPPTPPAPPQMAAAGTAPAAPQKADRGGKEARGKIVAGIGLEMLRIAIPLLGNSPLGLMVAQSVAKLGREITKPPQDLMQSEMTFMQQQLAAGGGGQPGPAAGPAMPPTPPAPPMAQAA